MGALVLLTVHAHFLLEFPKELASFLFGLLLAA